MSHRTCLILLAAMLSWTMGSGGSADLALHRESLAGAQRLDGTLPGPLLDLATPRQQDGSRDLFLLVAPPITKPDPGEQAKDDGPCPEASIQGPALWRMGIDAGSLELVQAELPHDVESLELLETAQGESSIFLARPGELLRLGAEAQALLTDPDLFPDPDRITEPADSGWFMVPRIGGAGFLRNAESALDQAVELELLIGARLTGSTLEVRSPVPKFVGRDANGLVVYATHPDVLQQRIRVSTLRPGASRDERRVEECWAQLPGPETILASRFHMLDGKPVLLVFSMPVGQVNLFGEALVRLFPLGHDRSRTGRLPLLAFKSRVNVLQSGSIESWIADVNEDGVADLAIASTKGFDRQEVGLDLYLGREDGSFGSSAKTTTVKVEKNDEGVAQIVFGEDLTGNGRADLLLRAGDRLLLYEGRPGSSGGKRIISTTPSRTAELPPRSGDGPVLEFAASSSGMRPKRQPEADRALIVVDMDGDGASEVLVTIIDSAGHAVISVVQFDTSRPEISQP